MSRKAVLLSSLSLVLTSFTWASWDPTQVWGWDYALSPMGNCQETPHGLEYGTPSCVTWTDCPVTDYEIRTGNKPWCRGGADTFRIRWSTDPCAWPEADYVEYTVPAACDPLPCQGDTPEPTGNLVFFQITAANGDGEGGMLAADGSGECRSFQP